MIYYLKIDLCMYIEMCNGILQKRLFQLLFITTNKEQIVFDSYFSIMFTLTAGKKSSYRTLKVIIYQRGEFDRWSVFSQLNSNKKVLSL